VESSGRERLVALQQPALQTSGQRWLHKTALSAAQGRRLARLLESLPAHEALPLPPDAALAEDAVAVLQHAVRAVAALPASHPFREQLFLLYRSAEEVLLIRVEEESERKFLSSAWIRSSLPVRSQAAQAS